MHYTLQFQKLCKVSKLGELLGEPASVSGGLLHRMYAVETTKGKYAVKLLNPQIMLRPKALQNYINSERIANFVSNRVPALAANKINGSFMQELDNQYYLVFDWIVGKSLRNNEIDLDHCKKIGAVLADLHTTDFSSLGLMKDLTDNKEFIDWNYYLRIGQEKKAVWVNQFLESIDHLNEWTRAANKAEKSLSTCLVISHRDLDSKNVLWNEEKPFLIDWESAGYINPLQDLIETALYWSEGDFGIDKERFFAFISGYKKVYGKLSANWELVLANGFSGKLAWLEYNLKRSLWIECNDAEDQKTGTIQVTETISEVKRYAETIPTLADWLTNSWDVDY